MLIVDAQIHLWNAGNPTSPWHRQIPAYLKDDALAEMEAGGVDAAVLTPHMPWDPNANELCIEAARQHPDKFAILGNFALDKPESRELIDTWKQRPGMLGLRFTFNEPHQRTWLTDGTVDWLWPAAERAGLPIALMAARFLPKVAEVAERHPNLKLILDHLGRPSGPPPNPERWANLPEVLALAKYPNVAMKATGAPSYSDEPYPFRDIHDNLHRLYDAFGPERWFWGTDISVPQISGVGDERCSRALASRDRLAGAGHKPPQAAWVKSSGRERCGKGAVKASGENHGRRTTVNCRSGVESTQTTSKPGPDVIPGEAWWVPAYWPCGVRHRGSASRVRALTSNCGNLRL